MLRKEQWKKVRNYPNYEVSDTGRVRSLDRTVSDSNNVRKSWFVRGVTLKPWLANGYKKVTLWNKHGKRKQYVHILVARAFVPNPKRLPEVNHIDEIRTNSRASNLEWRTHSGNVWHSAHKRGDGVIFCKARAHHIKPWQLNHGRKYIGRFKTLALALAYKAKQNWRHL